MLRLAWRFYHIKSVVVVIVVAVVSVSSNYCSNMDHEDCVMWFAVSFSFATEINGKLE